MSLLRGSSFDKVNMVQVLNNCPICTRYWLDSGANLKGYRYLIQDLHIPEAHQRHIPESSSSQLQPGPHHNANPIFARIPKRGEVARSVARLPTTISEASSSQPMPDDNPIPPRSPGQGKIISSAVTQPQRPVVENYRSWYFPLYKAAMDGDWNTGKTIFNSNGEEALRAKISGRSETALHIAVGSGPRTRFFVQELLKLLSEQDLEALNGDGYTALGIAAKVGNVEAARMLVEKHSNSLYIPSSDGSYPIHSAAECGHKEILLYLLKATQQGHSPDPYDPQDSGPMLLSLIIQAEFYDAALHLIKLKPQLAVNEKDLIQDLLIIAENPSAFSCWRSEGVFLPIFYACVLELLPKQSYRRDIENAAGEENLSDKCQLYWQRCFVSGLQKIHLMLWGSFEKIAPVLKHIKIEKMKGHQAKELVKCLCQEAANFLKTSGDAVLLFKMPLFRATENGIQEIIKEITDAFPEAVWCDSDLFTLAIEHRHHGVYNLLSEMGDMFVDRGRQYVDSVTKDNILHLAGRLAASDRLRIVCGAALQMQRELQWFKEIESLVQPAYKSKRNKARKTPQEVFSECHKKLLSDAEKWMRNTANSCTVAAVLIATMSFAASITIPGGLRTDNGRPVLSSETAFNIFGVANALSLFSSCASILMFLSILTSRYALDDFLRALPSRLMIGVLTLFISVASMMSAFSSTFYLMFGHERRWILGCVIVPCCLLVAMFASVHLSLAGQVIKNTYLNGIFKKRSRSKGPVWSCFFKKIN